jgi:hypothetical protein
MQSNYLTKKPIYSFNNESTRPVNHKKESVDLTFLTMIEIGFAASTAILMMSLILFFIIAWPWFN